jgi:hypothetical protein
LTAQVNPSQVMRSFSVARAPASDARAGSADVSAAPSQPPGLPPRWFSSSSSASSCEMRHARNVSALKTVKRAGAYLPPPPEALCGTFIEISAQAKRTARACLPQALPGATAQGAPGSRALRNRSEVAEAPRARHGGELQLCVSSDAAAVGLGARAVVRALHTLKP